MSEKDSDFIQWLGIKGAIRDYKADRTLEKRFIVIGYIKGNGSWPRIKNTYDIYRV